MATKFLSKKAMSLARTFDKQQPAIETNGFLKLADYLEAKRDAARRAFAYCGAAKEYIEALEAERFKLSAGVCEHRSGDDHGNPLCLKTNSKI